MRRAATYRLSAVRFEIVSNRVSTSVNQSSMDNSAAGPSETMILDASLADTEEPIMASFAEAGPSGWQRMGGCGLPPARRSVGTSGSRGAMRLSSDHGGE